MLLLITSTYIRLDFSRLTLLKSGQIIECGLIHYLVSERI
jgi:hypothetical protein